MPIVKPSSAVPVQARSLPADPIRFTDPLEFDNALRSSPQGTHLVYHNDRNPLGTNPEQVIRTANAMKFSKGTLIDLSENQLGATPEGVMATAHALGGTQAASVNLADNELGQTPKGAAAIAMGLGETRATTVNLSFNELGRTPEGAVAIARALSETRATTVDLSFNELGRTPEGAAAIVRALSETRAATVDLSGNELGRRAEGGVYATAKALGETKATAVDLQYNQLASSPEKAKIMGRAAANSSAKIHFPHNGLGGNDGLVFSGNERDKVLKMDAEGSENQRAFRSGYLEEKEKHIDAGIVQQLLMTQKLSDPVSTNYIGAGEFAHEIASYLSGKDIAHIREVLNIPYNKFART